MINFIFSSIFFFLINGDLIMFFHNEVISPSVLHNLICEESVKYLLNLLISFCLSL